MMTADVVQEIVTALTPFIGENMARSSARVHCEKLGIGGAEATPEQIALLITRFETGLCVFMGRERATSVLGPLRGRLGGGAR